MNSPLNHGIEDFRTEQSFTWPGLHSPTTNGIPGGRVSDYYPLYHKCYSGKPTPDPINDYGVGKEVSLGVVLGTQKVGRRSRLL